MPRPDRLDNPIRRLRFILAEAALSQAELSQKVARLLKGA